ncbi:MAG TPA: DMT family transporter [Gammaproteobacteria bacterium]|nr:DMT family transporter [Gammaproteobacteria bacterium]
MDSRRSLDAQAVGLMLILCLIWSMAQITLKATAADFSPVLQIALRSGVGAVLVAAFMLTQQGGVRLDGRAWRPGLLVGFLFALEFLLVGEGLRYTTASHLVVFLYTAPVFAALGLHWKLPSERLAPAQWVGIALAFSGIALTFLGRNSGGNSIAADMLRGDLLAVMAGAAWGATTVVIRASRLANLPATQTLLYQLLGGFVLLLLCAFALGQTTFNPTPVALASLAFQSVVVSFASYLAWFWLLRHYLASRLGVFSFLTPLLGVLLGAWLLHEPVEADFLLGALLVVTGIVLVSGYGWLRQLAGVIRSQRESA